MRYQIRFLCSVLSLFLFIQPAVARNGYFGIRGGISDVHENSIIKQYSSTGYGSGYVGAYAGPFRAEAEYTLTSNADFNEKYPLRAKFQRVMANAYIDVSATRYIRPYFGAGVGTAFYSVEDKKEDIKKTGTNFAWNATAGVGVKLTRNLTFDSGYRYVNMDTVEVKNNQFDLTAHEAYAGFRFLF